MANRFYSPRESWRGRSYISPDKFGNNEKMISHWVWGSGGSPDHPVAKLSAAYDAGLAAVDELRARRAEVEASNKYTALGISEQVGEHALTDSLPKLRRARAVVEKVKAEMAERAAKLTLPKPDPATEAQRAEMRALLRSLPAEERQKYVLANSGDPLLREAIVHAAPILSGVGNATHERLAQDSREAVHGEALGELNDLQEVIRTAERVVSLGRDELRETIGVERQIFEQIAAAAEANNGELPFRTEQQIVNGQAVDVCKVYDFAAKRWRDAQPQEIAATNGQAA